MSFWTFLGGFAALCLGLVFAQNSFLAPWFGWGAIVWLLGLPVLAFAVGTFRFFFGKPDDGHGHGHEDKKNHGKHHGHGKKHH